MTDTDVAEFESPYDTAWDLLQSYEKHEGDGLRPPARELAYDLKRTVGEDGRDLFITLALDEYSPSIDLVRRHSALCVADGDGWKLLPGTDEVALRLEEHADLEKYHAELDREWDAIDVTAPPGDYDLLIDDERLRILDHEAKLRRMDARIDMFRSWLNGSAVPLPSNSESLMTTTAAPQGDLIQSSEDFIKSFVAPDYLVDGIFQRRYFYAITAQTGVGKTALALLLSALVATGQKFGERDVEAGEVIYLAGENPDDVRARWIGLTESRGMDLKTAPVHFLPAALDLFENATRISEEVARKGIKPALVVVDTAAAYNRGDDENSNAQQVGFARLLRTLTNLPGGPCVIVLCHPPKNATGEDALLPRGGGAFLAELDGNVTVTKQDAVVTMRPGKFRGAANWWLSCELRSVFPPAIRDSKNRDVSTVVAVPISDSEKQAKDKDTLRGDNIVLKDVEKYPDDSLAKRAERMCWRLKSGAVDRGKMNRALVRLEKDKLIERLRGDAWAITRKGSLELSRLGLDGPPPGVLHPMFASRTVGPIGPPPI